MFGYVKLRGIWRKPKNTAKSSGRGGLGKVYERQRVGLKAGERGGGKMGL